MKADAYRFHLQNDLRRHVHDMRQTFQDLIRVNNIAYAYPDA